MEEFRIIVFTMHENEQALAFNVLRDKEVTNGYTIGTATEAYPYEQRHIG